MRRAVADVIRAVGVVKHATRGGCRSHQLANPELGEGGAPMAEASNFQRIRTYYIDEYLYRRYSILMSRLDQAFAALADPTRRGIVVHLARGEASVSDLVGLFSLTQPTISSHLKVLESAGLISRSRVAQSRPCKLETEQFKAVTEWLEQVQEIWEGNYKRLDALLAELKQAQKKEGKK
jgi:DNA-binding transcriptional ArsR family regulator